MPDLHGWITQQITAVEAVAHGTGQPSLSWQNFDMRGELRDDYNAGTVAYTPREETRAHIARHDPAAVLRRCVADRKILEEHKPQGGGHSGHYACEGCGYDGADYCSEPVTEHVNDCPTLLALAEGYGLTADQRAALDRPEPERPDPRPAEWVAYTIRDALAPRTPMADVPPALRGPDWREGNR